MWFVRAIPAVTFVVFATAIGVWLAAPSGTQGMALRLPGQDEAPDLSALAAQPVDLSGTFVRGDGKPAEISGEWPSFRGPLFDAISTEDVPLSTKLAEQPPREVWEITLGEGYAGPAIRDGMVYLLDYDSSARADVLRCLSLEDGKEIWRRSYDVDVKRNHGMSRTVPATDGKHVVTIGPKCHVLCVDAQSGEYRWGIDLTRRFKTKVPPWYAGQCPILDNGRVILAPGGSALMVAVDLASGEVVWETPNPRGWEMTHTSIIPAEVGGHRMFIYAGSGGVAGVDAETGELLWEVTDWRVKIAAVPSPVPLDDGRILLTGGYDAGSMMIQLVPSGDGLRAETLWRQKAAVLGAEQQTPIYFRKHIFAVIPGGQLVCIDPATGTQRWNSGATKFGIGPYMIARGVVYLTSDTGTLYAVAADPQEFRLLGSASVLEQGHEAWGPMALAGGRLLVRDLTRMVCLDMTEARNE